MAIEKNRHTLKNALRQMNTYAAPAGIWHSLDESFAKTITEPNEYVLKEAIIYLPEHSPPASVWNELTKSLDTEKTGKISLMRRRKRRLITATAAAVLLLASVWVFRESPPRISMSYAQETMQQFQLDIDWNTDEGSFERLNEQLAQLNDPQLNHLKMELYELTSARKDLEDMLKLYGQDPQLVNQLGDIERERSSIYRQIIELI